jgi:hypothetical protein
MNENERLNASLYITGLVSDILEKVDNIKSFLENYEVEDDTVKDIGFEVERLEDMESLLDEVLGILNEEEISEEE